MTCYSFSILGIQERSRQFMPTPLCRPSTALPVASCKAMSNCLIERSKATSPTHSTCSFTSNGDPERRFVSEVLEIVGYNSDTDRYELKQLFVRGGGTMRIRTPRLLTRWALITASIAALTLPVRGDSPHRLHPKLSCRILTSAAGYDARRRPQLGSRARQATEPGTDDSRFATGLLFLLTLAVAGFSVGHCRQGFNAPPPIRHLALAAFLLSGAFQTWAMIVNPFFSPVVRIQTERGHHLILAGPYRLMRHPGYFAMSISVPASALAIGSWIALMPAAGFVLLIKHRAHLEDEFLRNNLPGYIAYATRVGGPYAR